VAEPDPNAAPAEPEAAVGTPEQDEGVDEAGAHEPELNDQEK
jgi:hypothetical protein